MAAALLLPQCSFIQSTRIRREFVIRRCYSLSLSLHSSHGARLRDWRLRVFAATWCAYAGLYLCRKNFSVAMPLLVSERGMTKAELANLVFAFSLAYVLGQFAAGYLADRFGARKVVTLGMLGSVLCNLGMGQNPALPLFFLLGTLNGGAQSGWPGLVGNMRAWFPRHDRGVVMGWWTTSYALGGFAATLFASWVLSRSSLPYVFLAPAGMLAVVALGFALLSRNRPSDAGLPDLPEDETPAPARARLLGALSRPRVLVTGAVALLLKVMRYSFLFWLPVYLTERLGYAAAEAGYASSVYELVGFLGAVAAGYFSDRLMGSLRFPVAGILLAGLGAACYLHPYLASMGRMTNLIGIALIGMLTFGPDSLLQGAGAQDAARNGDAAATAGAVNGIASLGQLLSPFLVAGFASQYGWDALFRAFLFVALAGAALCAAWSVRPATLPDAA